MSAPERLANPLTEADIEAVRSEIPVLSTCTYLNAGGIAPVPRPVTEAIVATYRDIASQGEMTPEVHDCIPARMDETRGRLARLAGARPHEIALLGNTTQGINLILRGMPWKPGDEVIVTDQENPAVLLPCANLARRRGVKVRRLALSDDTDVLLARLGRLFRPKTRLLVLSHVTHVSGLVLPIAAIERLAANAGVPVLWDGAQALGQVPVDLKEAGCALYAGAGYKWLMGPYGTGWLYIRRDWLDRLDETDIGVKSERSLDLESLDFELEPSAARHEYGSRPWPLFEGLGAGIGFVERFGVRAVRGRMLALRDHACTRFAALPGATIVSASTPERASGLVTVAIAGADARAIVEGLWRDHRVLVRDRHLPAGAPEPTGIRFSLGFFNTTAEIDAAAAALERVLRA